jgi:outer membrane lipoprotein-sorting protein
MKKFLIILFFLVGFLFLESCSRKTTPAKSEEPPVSNLPVYKAPVKTPVPKMIVVNDKAATKTIEGRYYYDLEGKRYWRNKTDGKYYLYYKGMFEKKEYQ